MKKRFLAIIIFALLLNPSLSSFAETKPSPIGGKSSIQDKEQKKPSLEIKAPSPSPLSNNSSAENSNGQDRNNTFLDTISSKIPDIAAALFLTFSAYLLVKLETFIAEFT